MARSAATVAVSQSPARNWARNRWAKWVVAVLRMPSRRAAAVTDSRSRLAPSRSSSSSRNQPRAHRGWVHVKPVSPGEAVAPSSTANASVIRPA